MTIVAHGLEPTEGTPCKVVEGFLQVWDEVLGEFRPKDNTTDWGNPRIPSEDGYYQWVRGEFLPLAETSSTAPPID